MRLHQYIRYQHPAAQSRLLTRMAGIFIGTDVEPWPAIEGPVAHSGQIIGRQIVAEAVALVDRTPEVTGARLHCHTDAVAKTRRIKPPVPTVGCEGKDDGAALVRLPRPVDQTVGGVAVRADGDGHAAAVGRKDDVARPMTAARQVGYDRFRGDRGLQIASPIRKADYAIGIRDIDIARFWP